jgi:hypothetical protein
MKILTKIFNKITLRDHYRQKYDDMLFTLIESQYKPKVIATNKSIVFKGSATFRQPVFFFSNNVKIGGQLTFESSLSIKGKDK